MRKWLLLGVCLAFGTLAGVGAPYAMFEDAAPEEGEIRNRLWRAILQGGPVTVKLVLPKSESANRREWHRRVTDAFNAWFEYPAYVIRQSNREEEFADILPILDKGIPFGPNGVETTVVFLGTMQEADQKFSAAAYGCADMENFTIYTVTEGPLKEKWNTYKPGKPLISYFTIFAHEFGHWLGFMDQYLEDGLAYFLEFVLPRGHSSQRHVTQTIMSSSDNAKMGCDDVDAIINMIDLQRGGAQGKRRGTMWRSFCPSSPDFFQDGLLAAGYDYRIRADGGDSWLIDFGDGEFIEDSLADVSRLGINPREEAEKKGKVIKWDAQGRPLFEALSKKEVVYYEYFQGIVLRAAYVQTRDLENLLAWVEEIYPSRREPDKLVHVLHYNNGEDEEDEEGEKWMTENVDNIPI